MVSSVTMARILAVLLNIYYTVNIKNKYIILFNTLKQILQLKYLQSGHIKISRRNAITML